MKRLAAFDVDGTLTSRDCVVPFLRRIAGSGRLAGGIARRPAPLVRSLASRDRDGLKAVATRAALMGRAHSELRAAGEAFAAEVRAGWMRADGLAALERHRAAGDAIALVSASYELYLDPLGALLGVDHVLGTRLGRHPSGVLTGGLDGPNCRGVEKVRRLHELLDQRYGGRAAVHVVAYGDSRGDRELLADADEAHWVGAAR